MKTFKAVRFQIVNEHGAISEYAIEDGVIINKEGSGTGWLLEIVISNEHLSLIHISEPTRPY